MIRTEDEIRSKEIHIAARYAIAWLVRLDKLINEESGN